MDVAAPATEIAPAPNEGIKVRPAGVRTMAVLGLFPKPVKRGEGGVSFVAFERAPGHATCGRTP